MSLAFPEPTEPSPSRTEVLLGYLDYFRSVVVEKLRDLPDDELRTSRLPSGWTPLGMLKHLTYVELRWLMWRFEGESVEHPWGDRRGECWSVGVDERLEDVLRALHEQADRSRAIVRAHELSDVGTPGAGWAGAPPATLERVLLHLVQEYARHAGHADIVRELVDGAVGE